MNLRLFAVKICLPDFVKKKKLSDLFLMTARAFECEVPRLRGLSYRDRLEAFALFTKEEAEKCLEKGKDPEAVKTGLFQGAYAMGFKIRRLARLRTPAEIMEMSRILYRILGIDFEGKTEGDVTINRCFFSRYYSSPVCRLISALDEGLASGLSKGGRLTFSQRITEDKPCCKARFVMPEKNT